MRRRAGTHTRVVVVRVLVTTLAATLTATLAACTASGGLAPVSSLSSTAVPSESAIMGTFVYLPEQSPTSQVTLQLWSPRAAAPRAGITLDSADALASVTVSPDGRQLAYVHTDLAHNTSDLTVAPVDDGTSPRVLLAGAEPYCVEPSWSGDGQRVAAQTHATPDRVGSVAVATGRFAPFAKAVTGCHVLWSGDGSTIAFAGDEDIVIAHADGSNQRPVPRLGAGGGPTLRRSHDPVSLSADGRLLALFVIEGGMPDGDVGRSLRANEIVDTSTGAAVPLPVAGELVQAIFLPAGGLLVRVSHSSGMRIALLSADLALLATIAEPPALARSLWLGYGSG